MRKLSQDTDIALRQMAQELATGSIVNDALSRYLFQILAFVHEEYLAPQKKRIAELEERVLELEHWVRVLGGKPDGLR